MSFTKEEVIEYYNNIHNHESNIKFCVQWTEREGKEWRNEFVRLITPNVVYPLLTELFKEFNITTVEDIKTGRILKIL